MTDDRWGWVTDTGPDPTAPQGDAPAVIDPDTAHQQKQHINSDAAHVALELWAPVDDPPLPVDADVAMATSAPAPTAPVADPVRGGADAPTEQFTALGYSRGAQGTDPPLADLGQAWAETPDPAGDGLDELVTTGRARQARRRTLHRAGIAAGFLAAAVAVVATVVVLVLPDQHSGPAPHAVAAPAPVTSWCPVGTAGDTTTVAAGGDGRSPQAAVAAFVSALFDQRSPAAARAVVAEAATTPSVDELRGWIARLPEGQIQWCARITATDSPVRWQVSVSGRAGDARPQPVSTDTVYVSATSPTSWVIDAIVAQEGTQP
ncbi:hypothetical protein [uncultured Williamsia sp.]|uniref:hypothetical protein n=1 Tax=uncultured Williamsia sp. TaxID=259311 RepID=UPI002626AD38|nr:hypothetical protein [uncultured Williamsia sp.]